MKKYKQKIIMLVIVLGLFMTAACGQTEVESEEESLVVENIYENEQEILDELDGNLEQSDSIREKVTEISHIHGLEKSPTSDDSYLIATHHGVVEYLGSREAYVLGAMKDDFMGFSRVANSSMLMSSGHPSYDSELPDPLGFMWSEDYGQSWELRSLLGEYDFHALTASYQDENHILGFALDYENNFESIIFRSLDQGFTWEQVETNDLPLDHHGIYNLAFSPDDDLIVFAAATTGLFQSKDSGVHWTKLETGNISAISVIGNEEVYYYNETNGQLHHWTGKESETIEFPIEYGPINYLVVNELGEIVVSTMNASLLLKDEHSNWRVLIDNGKVQ